MNDRERKVQADERAMREKEKGEVSRMHLDNLGVSDISFDISTDPWDIIHARLAEMGNFTSAN